jgi:hypothetical protein
MLAYAQLSVLQNMFSVRVVVSCVDLCRRKRGSGGGNPETPSAGSGAHVIYSNPHLCDPASTSAIVITCLTWCNLLKLGILILRDLLTKTGTLTVPATSLHFCN